MELEHTFTVPVGVDDAWKVLTDVERVAPCMPGASLDSVDGDAFTGSVKVRLGPIGLTYKGRASFVEKDELGHRAVIDAKGKDARGNGTAVAKVTATLVAEGDATTVRVLTDLSITGKPAQFGRGVMADVGNKLIGQFADCLAGQLTAGSDSASGFAEASAESGPPSSADEPAEPSAGPAQKLLAPGAVSTEPRAAEPIDLMTSAGPAVLKRLAPIAAVVLAALLLASALRRRRR